ncbi:DUF4876 domain-containing protein [Mucilaginibacter sp. JRF]|uniref:DUF4876 domain-containing protein n=1 Tax=Mucilaginibacter sp. JRF TaxID=2780088 RepID=UPI0018804D7F|nr:DUF4876 domain-containing protein [Mucilaginibacter sp. JRF]MBE9585041.1 DUF4876 domain-containing protein [Mucilaginibacter sp. JRF]
MKHLNYFLLFMGMLILGSSCKKTDNNDVVLASLSVTTAFDADNANLGFDMTNVSVQATNLVTNQVYTAKSNATGIATFELPAGNYNIAASITISAADYNTKAGTNVEDDVIFNGTISNQNVVQSSTASISLRAGRIGDFVIKQIYYAGSSTRDGALFRDQFIEIYNNSNDTLYADSLYFGQVENVSTAVSRIDSTRSYYQRSGQWNWSESLNMIATNPNTDYIYAETMFMIPGTGKQHPVLPGQSIIIAANAINHKAPYTNASGQTVTVNNPDLTVDLQNADFEVYLGSQPGINPLASDVDNPAVTNVTVVSRGGNRDLVMDNLGREGLYIFKANSDVNMLPKYATPDQTAITTTTELFIQIPASLIIDGVGLQHAVTASRVPKRMPDVVDAGETFVTGGSYSSQSVVRKTRRTTNGRVVLQDTNNSTNDFGVILKADASKSASSFIN